MSQLMANITYPLSIMWESLFDYLELRAAERKQRRATFASDDEPQPTAQRANGGAWHTVAVR
ncbi:MAG: hypothetical protein WCD76_14290 [Pyrinomonadaceae bacterium]